jgi:hypothetical protein
LYSTSLRNPTLTAEVARVHMIPQSAGRQRQREECGETGRQRGGDQFRGPTPSGTYPEQDQIGPGTPFRILWEPGEVPDPGMETYLQNRRGSLTQQHVAGCYVTTRYSCGFLRCQQALAFAIAK